MNRIAIAAAAAAVIAGSAGAAWAHHSAVQFDFTKRVAVKGVVKSFEAINPHMRMVLVVTNNRGPHDVEFEGHSTNNMYRAGYRKGMVKIGDTLTVEVAPMKNGTEGGFVQGATTADGKWFGARARNNAAVDPAAARAAAEAR